MFEVQSLFTLSLKLSVLKPTTTRDALAFHSCGKNCDLPEIQAEFVGSQCGGELRKLAPHHAVSMQNWTFNTLCGINSMTVFSIVRIFEF